MKVLLWLWISSLAVCGSYLRDITRDRTVTYTRAEPPTNASVVDVTRRFSRRDLGYNLVQPSLVDLSDDETDNDPSIYILESRLDFRNVTFSAKKERWNPALVGNTPLFSVPFQGTRVFQIRFRLDDSASGRLATGLSNTKLMGPEFGLTGCFLSPDGNLLSSSLGSARVGFTDELNAGDVVDWLVEVHSDVTMDVWLMVNGAPKGLAFSLDFDQNVDLVKSLQPAVAFTGHSNGDTVLVVLFNPVSMTQARLLTQPYRQQISRPVSDAAPWVGHWDLALLEDAVFRQAREDNVDVVIGLSEQPDTHIVLSCNVVNSMSTVLTGIHERSSDHWLFLAKRRSPVVSTLVLPPDNLAIYETACRKFLQTVRILAYRDHMLGAYWSGGKMALVRAVQKVTPFADNPFLFATS
eukprot:Gregarina_sp_Pseudo_9__4596@NODE_477_length_2748_cov_90_379107_g451_i0_p1_GENE_NODE_477_length_2748_cov_90_379107_g451_i0NODE_477_length_2748_cov_90_379107_g451_i0_p1_ORF_typecomplete_len409_score101_39_NODE_477_length_2748_cov_90_379107_g451_i09862212